MINDFKKYLSWYLVGLALIVTYFLAMNHKMLISGGGKAVSIVMPFIFGILFAFILAGLMKWFEKRFKMKRIISFWLTYIVFFSLLSLFVFSIIPVITDNILDLLSNAQNYGTEIYNLIDKNIKNIELIESLELQQYVVDSVANISKWAASILDGTLKAIVGGFLAFVSGIAQIVMVLIISMYVMYDIEGFQERIRKIISALLGIKISRKVFELAHLTDDVFKKFFVGQSIDALVVGILCFIGLYFIGVPYAMLLSVIVAIFNMIPYIGPFIGGLPVVVIAFLDEPKKALFSIIFMLVLQQIEGNILAPRILGNTVGISPFSILLAIAIGGGLFGIAGMFLAVPVFKILQIIFDEYIDRRLEKQSKR